MIEARVPIGLKKRSIEGRAAYLQGYHAGVKHAAMIAGLERRSELAIKYGYEPKFHKVQKAIEKQIMALASLQILMAIDDAENKDANG